jgi:hypothetical protein
MCCNRQSFSPKRELGDDAPAAPPPPLSAQNRSGFMQALTVRTIPSAVTIRRL